MLYPDFDELIGLKNQAKHLDVKAQSAVISTALGDNRSPFRGQGLEFEEVRAYAPGDDVRNIDWRVTARTGSPHLKLFREERERNVMVCVDMNATMQFGTRGTFKSIQAARIAALLGWRALMNHDTLGGCLFGAVASGVQFFAPKRSRKSFWALLKLLCSQDAAKQETYVSVEAVLTHLNKAAATGSLIYILSDFRHISDRFAVRMGNLRKRCDVVLISIDDVADQCIPSMGDLVFAQNLSDSVRINTDDKAAQAGYQDNWQHTRDLLRKTASKLGIGLLQINTEDDVVRQLTLGLKRLSQRIA